MHAHTCEWVHGPSRRDKNGASEQANSTSSASEHAECFGKSLCLFCDKLSRTLSCYLRYHKEVLDLDSDGFASGERLLAIMQSRETSGVVNGCTMADLERIVNRSLHHGKARFEMRSQPSGILLIRATDKCQVQKDYRKRESRYSSSEPQVTAGTSAVGSAIAQTQSHSACSATDKCEVQKDNRKRESFDSSSEPQVAGDTSAVGSATAQTQSHSACSADAVVMDREDVVNPSKAQQALASESRLLGQEYAEMKKKLEALGKQVENQEEQIIQLRSELDRWNKWWYRSNG